MSATYIGKSLNYHLVEVESIVFNDIKEIDNWCTSTLSTNNMFESYTKDGKFYIAIDKNTGIYVSGTQPAIALDNTASTSKWNMWVTGIGETVSSGSFVLFDNKRLS